MPRGALHHIEIWVTDLDRATASWGWLLEALGYEPFREWPGARTWTLGETYFVIEQSPDVRGTHDRMRAGLNHLAFDGGSRAEVDRITDASVDNGWVVMFADKHPFAGGPDHYAAYLESVDGFEVELVSSS